MRARYLSGLAKRKICTSLIPISMNSTGCILFVGLFRQINAASILWYLSFQYRRCRFARMSTRGVVPNPLVARPPLSEWNSGLKTSSKKLLEPFSMFLVSPFFTFHLFSLVICSVSVIAVAGIL